MLHDAKVGDDRWNHCLYMAVQRLKGVELRHRAKFGRNRSNSCRDMTIFRFFKMAVVRHLGFVVRVFGPPAKSTWWFLLLKKMVGIGVVVLKIREFQYYACLAWKCLFTPLLGEFLEVKIGVTVNVLHFCPSRNAITWDWRLMNQIA